MGRALPDSDRNREPAFEHHPELPQFETTGARLTVFAGEFGGLKSPATMFSPIVGADAQFDLLRQEGCTQAQGYLFSPPRPADEVETMLTKARARVVA